MDKLIEALQIFLKYGNPSYPTHCEHDVMTICGIDPATVSDEDKVELDELGFFVSDDGGDECFQSYKYGSARNHGIIMEELNLIVTEHWEKEVLKNLFGDEELFNVSHERIEGTNDYKEFDIEVVVEESPNFPLDLPTE